MRDEVASIRARHKTAKPSLEKNSEWFKAEQDIARLLIVYDATSTQLAKARALLRSHGKHLDSCDVFAHVKTPTGACDCGLSEFVD